MTQLRIGLSQLLEHNYKHGLRNSFSLLCSFPAGIYLLKVCNEGTRTTPGIVLVPLLLTYFTPCSSVSLVNVEHVNGG